MHKNVFLYLIFLYSCYNSLKVLAYRSEILLAELFVSINYPFVKVDTSIFLIIDYMIWKQGQMPFSVAVRPHSETR